MFLLLVTNYMIVNIIKRCQIWYYVIHVHRIWLLWKFVNSFHFQVMPLRFLWNIQFDHTFNVILVICSYVGACVHEGQLHPLTEVRVVWHPLIYLMTLTIHPLLSLPVHQWRHIGGLTPWLLYGSSLAPAYPAIPGHCPGDGVPSPPQHATQRPKLTQCAATETGFKVHWSCCWFWTSSKESSQL